MLLHIRRACDIFDNRKLICQRTLYAGFGISRAQTSLKHIFYEVSIKSLGRINCLIIFTQQIIKNMLELYLKKPAYIIELNLINLSAHAFKRCEAINFQNFIQKRWSSWSIVLFIFLVCNWRNSALCTCQTTGNVVEDND